MRFRTAVALALLAGPASAGSHLTSTTAYADHLVRGTNATELDRDMHRHPIVDPDSGNAIANITHDHALKLTTAATSGGQCEVADLSFTWHFIITLPRAVDEAKLSSSTRTAWRAFVKTLRAHEEHHRDIFLGCGQRFVAAAATLTGPCVTLDRTVRQNIDVAYKACMLTQRAFDKSDAAHIGATPFMRLARP